MWLSSGNLKNECLMAAQDQASRTNVIKVKTNKQEDDVRCRMCKDREETVVHLTSECSKLAQLQYKKRLGHNNNNNNNTFISIPP